MLVSLYRYNPETDNAPYMQDIELELPEGKDLMVLDVLNLLKERDPSVAYRRSCREGVCGSDGMNMNGKNGLACITPMSEVVKHDKLVLRPLPGLPVIRDLVVDMNLFYQQYEKVQPYLINNSPEPAIERLQSPEDREKLDGLYSVFSVPAAPPPVRRSGGTRRNLSVRQDCCRPIVSWPTAVIPPRPSVWRNWMIRSVCSVAVAS